MEKLEVAAMGTQVETTTTCGLCRDETPLEQTNYMGNQQRQPYDPNSNTYNPGWGGNQHAKNNFQNRPPFQPFQRPPFPPPFPQQPKPTSTQSFEAALEKLTLTTAGFVQSTNQFIEEARANFRNQESSIRNLETQVGQIVKQLSTPLPKSFLKRES
ncbi:hypothetical protein PIB30_093516 [Stylosanthes scabra]|uniref:Uncharacterized protein n=1 Tax=Stylosanthes scabra TaxID=79078 RepID=A0ABU6UVX6_9FABA|nr:hypothetical protein [Stylosanthes scabra]